jgi:PAS domain S-box-containing protein
MGAKKTTARELLKHELADGTRELTTLLRLAEAVSETLGLDEVIQRTLEIIQEHFLTPLAIAMYLWDEPPEQLQLVGWRNLPQPWIRRCQRLNLDAPVIGEVQRTGQVVVLNTLEELEQAAGARVRQQIRREMKSYVSSVHIPLHTKRRTVGVLSVAGRWERQFSRESVDFFTALGFQIGVAIDRAQQQAAEQQRAERLELESQRLKDELRTLHQVSLTMQSTLDLDQLLKEITGSLVHRLGYKGAGIFLSAPRERLFVGAAFSADQPGLQQKVEQIIGRKITDLRVRVQPEHSGAAQRFLEGQVIVSHDLSEVLFPLFSKAACRAVQKLRGLKSLIVIPLMAKEEIVGGLFVSSDKMDLSQRDHEMLITFANQAAIAIANARLFEQEKKRAQQLALINQLGQQAASTLDLKTLSLSVAQDIHESFHYESVELWLVDEATDESVVWAHAGGLKGMIPLAARQKNSDGILGYVVRSGHTHLCNDVREDPWYIPAHLTGIQSELCAPIRIGEKIIGAINLESRQLNAFDESDAHVLETICRQIAHPIENALTLKFYKSILDTLPVATIILDAALQVVLVNRKFNELFGVSEEQAAGKPVFKLIPQRRARELIGKGRREESLRGCARSDWDCVLELIDQVRHEGGLREAEFSLPFPGVEGKILRAVISSIDSRGSEAQTLVMLEDINEKVHLTEHLIQSEKRSAMGELAITIAHELGNPLGIISSALQFVQDQLRRESKHVPEELELIADNVERMHELLKSLSEFSGPEQWQLSYADIHQALSRVLAFIRREAETHQVTLETRFDESVPLCRVNIKQLKQVFLNLFKNALEAMPEGGQLSVRTQRLPADLFNPEGTVLIEVSDTGPGIPGSELEAIFKPFYSTKEQGSGLGLFFCQQIIERHRGCLTVRSRPGRGTTFSIRLPITENDER